VNWLDGDVGAALDMLPDDDAMTPGPEMHALWDKAVRAIMSHAAALLAARGGTMTAEQVNAALHVLHAPLEALPGSITGKLRNHMRAQGARIAALEQALASAVPGAHLREVDAAGVRATQNGMAARISELEQHISDLEKSLENVRRERDEAYQKGRDDERAIAIPSGQVAEDVATVRRGLARIGTEEVGLYDGALHRLAAKAHGYEAAVADNAALARCRDLFERLARAARKPRDEQEALWREAYDFLHDTSGPHPGAALLERLKRLEEALVPVAAGLAVTAMDQERARYALGNPPMTCENASCLRCRSGWPCH
jgi:hypothetical protein